MRNGKTKTKTKPPSFLAWRRRGREIQRFTFNLSGLSCTKGLALPVLFEGTEVGQMDESGGRRFKTQMVIQWNITQL